MILPEIGMANFIPSMLYAGQVIMFNLKNSWNLQLIWVVTYCVVSGPIISDITMHMAMILNNFTWLQWQCFIKAEANTCFRFYISMVHPQVSNWTFQTVSIFLLQNSSITQRLLVPTPRSSSCRRAVRNRSKEEITLACNSNDFAGLPVTVLAKVNAGAPGLSVTFFSSWLCSFSISSDNWVSHRWLFPFDC